MLSLWLYGFFVFPDQDASILQTEASVVFGVISHGCVKLSYLLTSMQ